MQTPSEALSLYEQLEDPHGIAWSLDVFAGLMAVRGFPEQAAGLWGACDGRLRAVGGALPPALAWIRHRHIDSVKAALGDERFETTYGAGRAMEAAEAIALTQLELPGASEWA